jgi:predicted dehydrogenase
MDGGARGVLLASHATPVHADTVDIWGSEGSLHIGNLNRGDLTVKTVQGEREESHPPHANLHQPAVEDFVQAVAENRAPGVTGEVGREVSRLLEQIYHPTA